MLYFYTWKRKKRKGRTGMTKYLARADNTGVAITFQEIADFAAKMRADSDTHFSANDKIILYEETARGFNGSVFGKIIFIRTEGKWS